MSISVRRGGAPGELLVCDGERVERMFVATVGGVTWVFHDGAVFTIEDESAARRRGHHTHGSLSSPMPATVVAVKVTPGEEVKAGDTLIVLEAMKMELPVRAPGDGRVARVNCKAGDLVQPDVSLIDFE